MLLLATAAAVAFPALNAFEPTYEWKPVLEGQGVPAGLDVKLELHGPAEHADANAADGRRQQQQHHRIARIPQTWRLQVWLEDESAGFFGRVDVHRDTPIASIEALLAKQVEEHRVHMAEHDAAMSRRMSRSRGGGGGGGAVADGARDSCIVDLYHKWVRLRATATAEAVALFELQHALEPRVRCERKTN